MKDALHTYFKEEIDKKISVPKKELDAVIELALNDLTHSISTHPQQLTKRKSFFRTVWVSVGGLAALVIVTLLSFSYLQPSLVRQSGQPHSHPLLGQQGAGLNPLPMPSMHPSSLLVERSVTNYQATFPSTWLPSPNGLELATIDGRGPEAKEEGQGVLVIKSEKSPTTKVYEMNPDIKSEQGNTLRYVKWIDDQRVFVIVGYAFGTTSKGGKLYELDIVTNHVTPIMTQLNKNEEIVSVQKNKSGGYTYEKYVFDNADLTKGHMEEGTFPDSALQEQGALSTSDQTSGPSTAQNGQTPKTIYVFSQRDLALMYAIDYMGQMGPLHPPQALQDKVASNEAKVTVDMLAFVPSSEKKLDTELINGIVSFQTSGHMNPIDQLPGYHLQGADPNSHTVSHANNGTTQFWVPDNGKWVNWEEPTTRSVSSKP